ncbi:MAG: hypothetical protein JXX28_09320 [Deltaproteobacteria bacterium]|nr:hypothetical protein [Deltaproteobacteria bacterium]
MIAAGLPAPALAGQPLFGLRVNGAAALKQVEVNGLLVVFLKYPGSSVTRETLAHLDGALPTLELRGIAVVAVLPGDEAAARDLVCRLQIVHPVLHDPDDAHRARWGVEAGATRPSLRVLPRLVSPSRGLPDWRRRAMRVEAALLDTSGLVRWTWCAPSSYTALNPEALSRAVDHLFPDTTGISHVLSPEL